MRKRFEQQHKIGLKSISETPIFLKSRDDFPAVVAALKEIFLTPQYNVRVFRVLEDVILKDKRATGRPGMNLWQIFVLAQVRLALNIDYDRLEMMVNSNSVLRQLIGIETETGFERIEIHRQTVIDNVTLLDDKTLRKINDIIVEFGYEVLKKKETAVLCLKTDSYVVESNVHFPTDYNLLWDSARKALDIVERYKENHPETQGWRKSSDWRRSLKNLSRALGKASAARGKGKAEKTEKAAQNYIKKAESLLTKLKKSMANFTFSDTTDLADLISLEYFIDMLEKHINLVNRRLIQGETIPHEEKIFSIFETYTEWISKGKINRRVELGKRLSITSDQYGLIIDYHLHEQETDSEVVIDIADRVLRRYKVEVWSFDKGYWHKINKELLSAEIAKLIMPKKGKPNKEEKAEEQSKEFKKFRAHHSAVESNINELEHRGLDRCPDRGFHSFKRYVGLGVTAYNLHKIGKAIIARQTSSKAGRKKQRA